MGYTGEQKKVYDRERRARIRAAFFDGRTCALCGSSDRLELDHVNPETKVSHNIWSWSEIRRQDELKKCRVLCYNCHMTKSKTERAKGTQKVKSHKLTNAQIIEIRELYSTGQYTYRELSDMYDVYFTAIGKIVRLENWKHV